MKTSLLLLVLAPAAAVADNPKSLADQLYEQANAQLALGRTAEACDLFDQVFKLDPTSGTRLHQANCREKNGQFATAWSEFVEAAHVTEHASDDKSILEHKIAVEHATRLEPKLSSLTVNVGAASPGLVVTVDGDTLSPRVYGQTMPIDGGSYAVTARSPGSVEWTTVVYVLKERDAKVIAIPELRPVSAPAVEAPAEAVSHTTAYLVGGGGVALLGGAAAFALWGNSTIDRANAAREPDRTELWHAANAKRYAAEGLAVGGAAALGVAVWLYLRTPVAPIVTPESAGVQVVGRW